MPTSSQPPTSFDVEIRSRRYVQRLAQGSIDSAAEQIEALLDENRAARDRWKSALERMKLGKHSRAAAEECLEHMAVHERITEGLQALLVVARERDRWQRRFEQATGSCSCRDIGLPDVQPLFRVDG